MLPQSNSDISSREIIEKKIDRNPSIRIHLQVEVVKEKFNNAK